VTRKLSVSLCVFNALQEEASNLHVFVFIDFG
jgi:hypothetical protein